MSQNKRKMNNKPPKKNSTSPNRMIISKNKLENIKSDFYILWMFTELLIFTFCERESK